MHINNLKIVPDWRLQDSKGQTLHSLIVPLLDAVQRTGKLTVAAKQCGLSYRHAWNVLQQAEAIFDQPVTSMERGKGAKLTELGCVLLQSQQRIEARLHTQLESLEMELNGELHRVLSDQIDSLPIYASHGFAVSMVPSFIKQYQVEMHFHGPEDALLALHAGSCKIAGFHLPLHIKIPAQQQRYRNLLSPSRVFVLNFIRRQQGLMVAPEKQSTVKTLEDLCKPEIRLINRNPRSGTRELFDHLLKEAGVNSALVRGYENHEYTHSAVAAHVATGMADVGFGVQAAAAKFDLCFVPIVEDTYLWALRKDTENDDDVLAFIETLKSSEFQFAINQLPGYECVNCGNPAKLDDLLSAA
jgi:molybdate transport repressor ModE-like protein